MNKALSLVITSAITLIFSVSCAFGAQMVLTNKLSPKKDSREIVLEENCTPSPAPENAPAARCL